MTLRICLTGVESTGKSTLANRLAAHFGAVVMPEYGREWAETHGLDFTPAALRAIAHGHIERRTALLAAKPALMIEDTDIVMTSAWAHMLGQRRDPDLSNIPASASLYLLFAPDTVWIDDGTRQFGGGQRAQFQAIIVDELARRGITPVLIGGDWEQRFTAAVAAIARLF